MKPEFESRKGTPIMENFDDAIFIGHGKHMMYANRHTSPLPYEVLKFLGHKEEAYEGIIVVACGTLDSESGDSNLMQ